MNKKLNFFLSLVLLCFDYFFLSIKKVIERLSKSPKAFHNFDVSFVPSLAKASGYERGLLLNLCFMLALSASLAPQPRYAGTVHCVGLNLSACLHVSIIPPTKFYFGFYRGIIYKAPDIAYTFTKPNIKLPKDFTQTPFKLNPSLSRSIHENLNREIGLLLQECTYWEPKFTENEAVEVVLGVLQEDRFWEKLQQDLQE